MALTDKLTAIGNAIRAKTGKTEPLTLDAMPGEIEGISGGEEVYTIARNGTIYKPHTKIMVGDVEVSSVGVNQDYAEATELISFETDGLTNGYRFASKSFQGCTKLETVKFPRFHSIVTPIDIYARCSSLKTVQYGSIGYPVTTLSDSRMLRSSAVGIELTIYVDATTIAEIPGDIKNWAPWGNSSAIIIYRNSTTGEVITE